MADILIRGIEMPKEHSLWILIRPDGTVYKIKNGGKFGAPQIGTAIPIPENHGRLGDLDKLAKESYEIKTNRGTYQTVINIVDLLNTPTIIPAEGGGEE